jgi:hypothetical protein
LIIHHAQGNDPNALCMFVNMSKEPVHIQCAITHIRTEEGYFHRYITDYNRITPQDQNVQSKLRQGPVQPGGYLILGTFEDILLGRQSEPQKDESPKNTPFSLRNVKSLELCIAVVHGPSKFHIGARRHFVIEEQEGELVIRSQSIHTEQLVSRRKRKIVRGWIESHLDPKLQGKQQTQTSIQTEEEMRKKEAS